MRDEIRKPAGPELKAMLDSPPVLDKANIQWAIDSAYNARDALIAADQSEYPRDGPSLTNIKDAIRASSAIAGDIALSWDNASGAMGSKFNDAEKKQAKELWGMGRKAMDHGKAALRLFT